MPVVRCLMPVACCLLPVADKMNPPMVSFPKNKISVVLLENVHPSGVQAFKDDGYTSVTTFPATLEGRALIDAIHEAHIVGLRSRTKLTADVIAQARRLMAVGCFCIGTDQVDLDVAA